MAIVTGMMADDGGASMPHPLATNVRSVELACASGDPAVLSESAFAAAFCAELARLIETRLSVPVRRVVQKDPANPASLPRAGLVRIDAVVSADGHRAAASASWGSDMRLRGVAASEHGPLVEVPVTGGSPGEQEAVALAAAVVDTLPFVPRN